MKIVCTDGVSVPVKKSTIQQVPLLRACTELGTGSVHLTGRSRFLESDVVLEFVRWLESGAPTSVRPPELIWLLMQCSDYMGMDSLLHVAVPRAAALLVRVPGRV
jgi:hypothetical protein